jgi:hypothetical protein
LALARCLLRCSLPPCLPLTGALLARRLSFAGRFAFPIFERILAFVSHVLAMVVVVFHHVFPMV